MSRIYENRREFLAVVNLPIDEIKKRKNLTKIMRNSRKPALDDFKLEPIDDEIEDSPDVKMEVFKMKSSEEAIKHG